MKYRYFKIVFFTFEILFCVEFGDKLLFVAGFNFMSTFIKFPLTCTSIAKLQFY